MEGLIALSPMVKMVFLSRPYAWPRIGLGDVQGGQRVARQFKGPEFVRVVDPVRSPVHTGRQRHGNGQGRYRMDSVGRARRVGRTGQMGRPRGEADRRDSGRPFGG